MNLYLRLLWLALVVRRRPPCGVLGPCRTPFRVWPTDLDLFRHVNNGRYLSIMDLGRVDLMIRSGFLRRVRARGWYFVVDAETIQFRRPLTLFQRFAIETRVAGWDERGLLIEQRFVRDPAVGDDDAIAVALVRARFMSRTSGPLPTAEALAVAGEVGPSPALPDWMARWNTDQVALRERDRRPRGPAAQ